MSIMTPGPLEAPENAPDREPLHEELLAAAAQRLTTLSRPAYMQARREAAWDAVSLGMSWERVAELLQVSRGTVATDITAERAARSTTEAGASDLTAEG